MVSPSAEMAYPNLSPAAPSDAVSFTESDVSAHPASGMVKTYAAPGTSPFSPPGAPTTTLSPAMATA